MNIELRGLLTGFTVETRPSPYEGEVEVVVSGPMPDVTKNDGSTVVVWCRVIANKEKYATNPITFVQRAVRDLLAHEAEEVLFADGKQVNKPHKEQK